MLVESGAAEFMQAEKSIDFFPTWQGNLAEETRNLY